MNISLFTISHFNAQYPLFILKMPTVLKFYVIVNGQSNLHRISLPLSAVESPMAFTEFILDKSKALANSYHEIKKDVALLFCDEQNERSVFDAENAVLILQSIVEKALFVQKQCCTLPNLVLRFYLKDEIDVPRCLI
jgi:hypothetical protein